MKYEGLWVDAFLLDCVQYARGSKLLCIPPSWRPSMPESLWIDKTTSTSDEKTGDLGWGGGLFLVDTCWWHFFRLKSKKNFQMAPVLPGVAPFLLRVAPFLGVPKFSCFFWTAGWFLPRGPFRRNTYFKAVYKLDCWKALSSQICGAQTMLVDLPSRLYSSSTLLGGSLLIRGASMNLEGDEEYQKMVAERDRLLEAQQNIPPLYSS